MCWYSSIGQENGPLRLPAFHLYIISAIPQTAAHGSIHARNIEKRAALPLSIVVGIYTNKWSTYSGRTSHKRQDLLFSQMLRHLTSQP